MKLQCNKILKLVLVASAAFIVIWIVYFYYPKNKSPFSNSNYEGFEEIYSIERTYGDAGTSGQFSILNDTDNKIFYSDFNPKYSNDKGKTYTDQTDFFNSIQNLLNNKKSVIITFENNDIANPGKATINLTNVISNNNGSYWSLNGSLQTDTVSGTCTTGKCYFTNNSPTSISYTYVETPTSTMGGTTTTMMTPTSTIGSATSSTVGATTIRIPIVTGSMPSKMYFNKNIINSSLPTGYANINYDYLTLYKAPLVSTFFLYGPLDSDTKYLVNNYSGISGALAMFYVVNDDNSLSPFIPTSSNSGNYYIIEDISNVYSSAIPNVSEMAITTSSTIGGTTTTMMAPTSTIGGTTTTMMTPTSTIGGTTTTMMTPTSTIGGTTTTMMTPTSTTMADETITSITIPLLDVKVKDLGPNNQFNQSFTILPGTPLITINDGQFKIENISVPTFKLNDPIYLYGPVKESFGNFYAQTLYDYVLQVMPADKVFVAFKINSDGTMTSIQNFDGISNISGTYKIIDTPYTNPSINQDTTTYTKPYTNPFTTQYTNPSTTTYTNPSTTTYTNPSTTQYRTQYTTSSPTLSINNTDYLIEKGIKVLGSYLNNPMKYALEYSTPGTFLSQIDYNGSTNIYSPLIKMGNRKSEQFSNKNDPDKYYHY